MWYRAALNESLQGQNDWIFLASPTIPPWSTPFAVPNGIQYRFSSSFTAKQLVLIQYWTEWILLPFLKTLVGLVECTFSCLSPCVVFCRNDCSLDGSSLQMRMMPMGSLKVMENIINFCKFTRFPVMFSIYSWKGFPCRISVRSCVVMEHWRSTILQWIEIVRTWAP